ncbi:MAG: transcription termination factor Rho [Clostridiales bacterium]|nr:transcription termination factor Rho [Clostridiales bacterium]
MLNPSDLPNATLAELRQFARDRDITLGSLRTKADILERIQQAILEQLGDAAIPAGGQEKPEEAAPQPERRAMIITDDGDDLPVMQVGRSSPGPAPAPPPASRTTTSTGKNKPAFTLAGARAWHNPQPFANTPPPNRYAPLTPNLSTFPGQAGAEPVAQVRPAPRTAARFGPEAAKAPEPVSAPMPVIPQGYRPSAFAQPAAGHYQPPAPPAYAPPLPPDVGREAAPYRREYAPPADGRTYRGPSMRVRDAQPREQGGVNPAVPEMLATGDCGEGSGVLEIHSDGYGFLRAGNFLPGKNDVYISNAQIRRFALRDGDFVEGKTRPQREGDRYAAMLYITSINGQEPEDIKDRCEFDELTPVYPNKRIQLSSAEQRDPVLRFIDLFVPVGFGQRALIVAPPKAGKTTILKKIALSLRAQHPEVHLMTLLVDERPEEVTDLKETVGGDVFYSTFDEPVESHARVSELVRERAMRLVEQGKDVVVLMDSLTRMSRAFNTLAPNTARIMSGGVAAGALHRPKRFFGAARNLKEGGSLTIIATVIVETGSRMDDVIYEEFKGTGNMELTLDRGLQELRIFPAVSILRSGTRHDELLLTQAEADVAVKVRRMISGSSEQEGISLILSMMEKTKDNEDFVARFDQWAKMMSTGRAD